MQGGFTAAYLTPCGWIGRKRGEQDVGISKVFDNSSEFVWRLYTRAPCHITRPAFCLVHEGAASKGESWSIDKANTSLIQAYLYAYSQYLPSFRLDGSWGVEVYYPHRVKRQLGYDLGILTGPYAPVS